MTNSQTVNLSKIQKWIAENSDSQKIEEELKALGYDDENIKVHLKEFKKVKNGKRQTNAFIFLAVGSILGFISCLLGLTNPVPDMYHLFLYGFTTLAAVIIFIGLYLLFE
jgi:hypothetical protein